MYPDEKYRAFLLGTADEETEVGVEEGLLDGRINPSHLQQIEEELIDDIVFGRLSKAEERIVQSEFVSAPGRVGKLKFARALQYYAAQREPEATRRGSFLKLRGWVTIPWTLPLAGALGCAVLAVVWLGERNLSLSRELASANDERQTLTTSLREEQRHVTQSAAPPIQSTASKPVAVSPSLQNTIQTGIRLSPGVSRGLVAVPVLHLNRQATTVSIVLELPFTTTASLHEELVSSEDVTIWSQQFSIAEGVSNNGLTTIVLPAGLLATGDYRLRVEAGASSENAGGKATYLFRVHKD